MGKLRLKLQDIMPHVWYRRLKLEIGNHANYKRWSSQRKLFASKTLVKALALNTHTDSAQKSHSHEEGDSAQRETHERKPLRADNETQQRETPCHSGRQCEEKATPSKTQRKPLLHEERETQERKTPSLPEKEAALKEESQTHDSHTLSSPLTSNKLVVSPLSRSHVERESPLHEERETHGATQTHLLHIQQAPSLSSPYPLSEKRFHLNMLELEVRLKALNTQERRLYYSSPIFTGATPTPNIDSDGFRGKLDIDSFDLSVNSPFQLKDKSFAARKLFCEEVKPSNERSSSHASTSFTGPSITSSEDTGFEKAPSSIWERDLSPLTSEGSELFPAIHEIENTLNSLRRRARRVRRDAPAKQRRRQKEATCKVLHAIDDYKCIHDATFCTDFKCPSQAHGKGLQSSLNRKFKISMGLRAQAQEALQSTEELSECVSDVQVDEGDDILVHKSFPYETLSLDSISGQPFSPCYYADCDKLSPIQCSDSALSESESCGSYENRGHQEQSSFGSKRLSCKQGVFSDKADAETSLPYNDVYREILQHTGSAFDAESGIPTLSSSKSICRSPHSNVCDCHNDLLFSKKASFDPNTLHPKSRGTFKRRFDASVCHDGGNSFLTRNTISDAKGGLSSPSYGTCSWRDWNDSPFDNQIEGYSKSPSTWRTPDDIPCDIQDRLQILKSASKRSAEGDYDGDESLHSFSGTVASLSKGNSRREINGNEGCSATSLSKSPSTFRTFNDGLYNNQSKSLLHAKSASNRSIDGDYLASMSKRGLDCNECSSVASMSKGYMNESKSAAYVASGRGLQGYESHSNGCNTLASVSKRGLEGYEIHSNECSSVGLMSKSDSRKRDVDGYGCNSVESMSKRSIDGYESNITKSSSRRDGEDGKESKRGAKRNEERGSGKKGGEGEGEGKGGQDNWYKGGLRVVGEKERKEKSKVYESFAMVKCSENPSQDFKESMMDMILHKKLHDSMDLVELLHCFLSLNSPRYHDTIVKAFIDLWSHFYHPSP